MAKPTLVKNNIIKPFDTVFLIVFGFILTEHIQNVVKFFIIGTSWSRVILGITIFILLFLSIVETVLDYTTSSICITSEIVKPSLIRHAIWFFQFFPMYYIVDLYAVQDINHVDMCKKISLAMCFIYLLYVIINLVKIIWVNKFDEKCNERETSMIEEEIQSIRPNILLYFSFIVLYAVSYSILFNYFDYPLLFLSALLIITLCVYLLYWKNYYEEQFFTPEEIRSIQEKQNEAKN